MGMDCRQQTPELVRRVVFAAAETRSFGRAAVALEEIGGNRVSAKTIERVALQIGQEIQDDLEDAPAEIDNAPELAVIQVDGGRIRVRQQGNGPGVHNPAWRESKTACLLRMSSKQFQEDPHPNLPMAFRSASHVAEIAGKPGPEDVPSLPRKKGQSYDWRPRPLLRTCVASLAPASEFEQLVVAEATRRQFQDAPRRAYLGDGLSYNWTIHRRQFADYEPILDFIHVLQYVYEAAMTITEDQQQGWETYLFLAEACWQGKVCQVVQQLTEWLAAQSPADDELADDDPRVIIQRVRNYLNNNSTRMNYPRYRQAGLPVTSTHAESLIKEMNWRVKGTEMFWNEPDGAEAILQLRAATLSQDGRVTRYLNKRPGHPFVRRSSRIAA